MGFSRSIDSRFSFESNFDDKFLFYEFWCAVIGPSR